MNTEKDPKKDPDLSKKETKKGEEKGKSVYISKRTGLRHRKITIMIPEMVYRDILECTEREFGKPSPRKVSEILIRAFYYYKNHDMIQIRSIINKQTETGNEPTKTEVKRTIDIGEILNQAFLKIPQTDKLKEKFVKVLYSICSDRKENISECVESIHQITSNELETAITKTIGSKRDTIEDNMNAFIRSGLLSLHVENKEKRIKIFTIMMSKDERKEYLARVVAKMVKAT